MNHYYKSGLLRYARNDGKSQSGSAIIIILVAVALFGALMYTFMRGAQQGQGNMSAQQAKIAAQELASYFNSVSRAAEKLMIKGCSATDISFASSLDTGPRVIFNDSTTAPLDKSCHIFDSAGGGLTPPSNLATYLDSPSVIDNAYHEQLGQVYYRFMDTTVIDLGTSGYDYSIKYNFIKPEICEAYNSLLQNGVDTSIPDPGKPLGDDNPTLKGKVSACFKDSGTIQRGGPNIAIRHVWAIN